MSLLLCFSGQIGSGKSSVSLALAEALGWRRTGFGDYLRSEIARLDGDPGSREALQDLGQSRVDDDPSAFCRDVLAAGSFRPGDNFVIDGIRHLAIFEILRILSTPTHARLIFLAATEATRIARVDERSGSWNFARASGHRVESELRDALPQRADGLVSADRPIDLVVADCLDLVKLWQQTIPHPNGSSSCGARR
jgi:cytidylate kinase